MVFSWRFPSPTWYRSTHYSIRAHADEAWTDVLSVPTISTEGLSSLTTYIVFFIDIDVIWNESATTILHWYQPNLVVDLSTETLINKTDDGAAYVGPRPPPGTNHRYVFLLFEQPEGYVFPECYSGIREPTSGPRAGFDMEHFMQVTKLQAPVGANYFFVANHGDVTTTLSATTTFIRTPVCSNEVATPAYVL